MRSYSRNSGDTSCEHTRRTRAPPAPWPPPARARGSGPRAAGTPRPRRRRPVSPAAARGIEGLELAAVRVEPAVRPRTGARGARAARAGRRTGRTATAGPGGRSRSRRRTRASSRARRVRAIASSSAFVATVEPCASSSGRPGSTAATPVRTAWPGSSGVDGVFTIRPSSATTSVNVPPVSTPIRIGPACQMRHRALGTSRRGPEAVRSDADEAPEAAPPQPDALEDHGAHRCPSSRRRACGRSRR